MRRCSPGRVRHLHGERQLVRAARRVLKHEQARWTRSAASYAQPILGVATPGRRSHWSKYWPSDRPDDALQLGAQVVGERGAVPMARVVRRAARRRTRCRRAAGAACTARSRPSGSCSRSAAPGSSSAPCRSPGAARRPSRRGSARGSSPSRRGYAASPRDCRVQSAAKYVANPSDSHRCPHSRSVTASPNHWCAVSCAMMPVAHRAASRTGRTA